MGKLDDVIVATKKIVSEHDGSIGKAGVLANALEAKAREIREAAKNTPQVDVSRIGQADDISGDCERLVEILSDSEITMDEAREAAELASTISGNASDLEGEINEAIEEAEENAGKSEDE